MKPMKPILLFCILGVLILHSGCNEVEGESFFGDPLYSEQWYLKNTGQTGGKPGEDLNVEPVWNSCAPSTHACHGEGITIAIVDGPFEILHEDLAQNGGRGSYNYVTGTANPTPLNTSDSRSPVQQAEMAHGTACGGIAAARDNNGLGGRGVAPRAKLAGINLLENDTAFNEADAMLRGSQTIAISNNSWGVPDGYGSLSPSDASWRKAIEIGITEGRGKLGVLYVWGAGNGAKGTRYCPNCEDNSNYDGQANFRGVIAVASLNHQGVRSTYSEKGANLWISGYGGEFCKTPPAITTTDLMGPAGFNPAFSDLISVTDYANQNYTKCMNGTSAASPQIAGVIALMLQANPALSWRDVRIILAQSARMNDAGDSDWKVNGAGFHINHQYGFGVADTEVAVRVSKSWSPIVAPYSSSKEYRSTPLADIPPSNSKGISDTIRVQASGIQQIEWIEIRLNADSSDSGSEPGNLEVVLENKSTGTLSILAEKHECWDRLSNLPICPVYENWTFGSARHLGESADGEWILHIRDVGSHFGGKFTSWGLKFYGR